jgi:hypothetical protein
MATRYRALDYKGAFNDLLHKAREIQAKPVAPRTRKETTTVHSVELKIGNKSHIETFATKAQANQWAKYARKDGYEAHVY